MEALLNWINANAILMRPLLIITGFFAILLATDFIFKVVILRNKEKMDVDGDGVVNEVDARIIREGYIIGKCENLIIVIFVLADALTGLSLIFAAKSLARKKDIDNNAGFFLVGTLVNFTATLILAYGLQFVLMLLFN